MITILTPTYNRAHTLRRLYQSLEVQTDQRFEWLVVDDGSSDGTPALLNELSAMGAFRMRVIRQQNSGKHVAINVGVRETTGDWVIVVDSDDALTPDAVCTIFQNISEIERDIVGLCFRRSFFHGMLIGRSITSPVPLSLHPTQAKRLFQGDLAYVLRRDALIAHPFPVIPRERFIPELYIWNLIGDDGSILFYSDKVIYLCEYLPDGYTANFLSNLHRNPQGFLLFYLSQISRETRWIDKAKCFVRSLQCVFAIVAKGRA